MKAREIFIVLSFVILGAIAALYQVWPPAIWILLVVAPIIIIGYTDIFQSKSSIRLNFPVIGHFRYMLEAIRPEIMQYFVETDTEGRPINRIFRSLIYQRAKNVNDTTPFGTQLDLYQSGYEWMNHSIYAKNFAEIEDCTKVVIGGPDCKQPYTSSILNISAMSFGALSKNAVMAMNLGAKIGGFAQNTGEGAISPYHLKHGGDLIWQIGTGYFGCRTEEGTFSPDKFKKKAAHDAVKMIEIKISQGAKPGHGGMLPACKNTEEIANIRNVKPYTDVHSPTRHSAFSDPISLVHFIKELRDLSGGKPIGFKLCMGQGDEFISMCEAMVSTGISPDFITVDGGEGGTGAAPVEFSNSLGMPLRDGLAFAVNTLNGFNLKEKIKVIASGKIFSGFHMIKIIALGADMCNSARAVMMAAGCIQALKCNQNTCPVGITTQNKSLMKGLVVESKAQRVANFHTRTVESFSELIAAAGLLNPGQLKRKHINRRISMHTVNNYEQIYPSVEKASLLIKSGS